MGGELCEQRLFYDGKSATWTLQDSTNLQIDQVNWSYKIYKSLRFNTL